MSGVRRRDTRSIKKRQKEQISGAGLLLANRILNFRKKRNISSIIGHILAQFDLNIDLSWNAPLIKTHSL